MRLIKIWLRIPLPSTRQQTARSAAEDNRQGQSCFEDWIRRYCQRLDSDRGRHENS